LIKQRILNKKKQKNAFLCLDLNSKCNILSLFWPNNSLTDAQFEAETHFAEVGWFSEPVKITLLTFGSPNGYLITVYRFKNSLQSED